MRQRNRPVGLAVKVVEATEHLVPAGGGAEHAHSRLDRRRAGVVELETAQIARQHLDQFLHQERLHASGKVVGVNQLMGVSGNRLAHLRMAVTQRRHINARGKVNVAIPVHVHQHAAVARLEGHRKQLHLAAQPLEMLGAAAVVLIRHRSRRRHNDSRASG